MSQYRFTQNYEELQTIFNRAEQGGEIDQNISAKYTKPATGIPATDLTSALQTTISGSEQTANKRTSTQGWSASPSDTNYTSEKLVADRFATTERTNAIQQREIDNLKEALADTTTIQYPDTTYQKGTVPSGVCKYASVNKIIGASRKTKNLLNPTLATATRNGVTCTKNDDGTYTLSGTSTANFDFYLVVEGTSFPNGTYKVVGCPSGLNNGAYIRSGSEGVQAWNDTGNGATITISNGRLVCRIAVSNGATLNNAVFKPMITTDLTATYADYEQYFEGIRSATITKVISVGVNLFDKNNARLNKWIGTSQGALVTDQNAYTTNDIYVNAGQTIYIPNTGTARWGYWKPNMTDFVYMGTGGSRTFTAPYDCIVWVSVIYNTISVDALMINNGDHPLPYSPYAVDELVLPEPIQLRSAGTVADEYTPITGVIDRSHLKEVDLGSLTYSYISTRSNFVADLPLCKTTQSSSAIPNIICGKYNNVNWGNMYYDLADNLSITIHDNLTRLYIKDTAYTDPTAFRNAVAGVTLTYECVEDTSQNRQVTPINPFIQCESGGEISLVHTESPATESRFTVEYENSAYQTTGSYLYGFHINANESNPSTAVTYLYDAVGMTPAYMDYANNTFNYGSWGDAFFLPKPCMVGADGRRDYYLDPNDYTKKADGVTASDVANTSYNGNAMMEWGDGKHLIWMKVVADRNDAYSGTVYISDHKVDDNFTCYPFINSQGRIVKHFYTPIYNGSLVSNKLRSISGQTVMKSKNAQQEIDYAKANYNSADQIWNTEMLCDIQLINALLILIGKSLDTQSVFGQGNANNAWDESKLLQTGTMNTKGLFWGENTGVHPNGVKVFGMENWWGNQWRRFAGLINDNGTIKVKMTYGREDGSTADNYNLTGSGYINVGVTPSGSSGGYINKSKFTGFGLIPAVASGSSSTYYCDGMWFNNAQVDYPYRGGILDFGSRCGAFSLDVNHASSVANNGVSASPSCKPLL